MKAEILATGSTGNAVILNRHILIDIGIAYRPLKSRQNDLKIVLLSHIHGDHYKPSTVKSLSSARPSLRWACGEWMVDALLKSKVSKTQIDVLEMGKIYDYGYFCIEPFSLKHDVPNCGWKIYFDGKKAIYATDTGNLNGVEAKDFDLFLLEANHDETELQEIIKSKEAAGEFAYEKRVMYTHLSYQQANDFIYANAGPNSEYIYLHQHQERTMNHEHD